MGDRLGRLGAAVCIAIAFMLLAGLVSVTVAATKEHPEAGVLIASFCGLIGLIYWALGRAE